VPGVQHATMKPANDFAAVLGLTILWLATGAIAQQPPSVDSRKTAAESRPGTTASLESSARRAAESRPVFVRRKGGTPEVLFSLARSVCFGECPEYRVEVVDDGTVRYRGSSHVEVKGDQTATLTDAQVQSLIDAFVDARYFELLDAYDAEDWTDFPSVTTSFRIAGRTKTIKHYLRDVLAPRSLFALENRIDEILDTKRWVGANSLGPAATTHVGGPSQVGLVEAFEASTKSVVVKVSAPERVVIGASMVVSTEKAYVGRIRIFRVAKDLAFGELEHIEQGVEIQAGQIVWTRARTD